MSDPLIVGSGTCEPGGFLGDRDNEAPIIGTIYLIHIAPRYRHARHYLGWTGNGWGTRLRQHLKGSGSPLLRAAVSAGSSLVLARLWEGTRNDERALKNLKNTPMLCPICAAREGRKTLDGGVGKAVGSA